MPQSLIKRIIHRWSGKEWASLSLLAVGLVGTFYTPVDLLRRVEKIRLEEQRPLQNQQIDAAHEGNFSLVEALQPDVTRLNDQADHLSEWSYGLIMLGPSLIMTSILTVSSTQGSRTRRWIGVIALAFAAYVYIYLARNTQILLIPSILGFAGVLYCLLADWFAPQKSNDLTKRNHISVSASRWKRIWQAIGISILFIAAIKDRRKN